jgi:membrane protein DedA with SNARE-associated domain
MARRSQALQCAPQTSPDDERRTRAAYRDVANLPRLRAGPEFRAPGRGARANEGGSKAYADRRRRRSTHFGAALAQDCAPHPDRRVGHRAVSDWIESIVRSMRHLGVLFLAFLENVFPPIPSELVMPLAGFVSSQGRDLNVWLVIAAGTAGAVAGAVVLYYVGHFLGGERLRGWLSRHGHWLMLSESDLDRAQDWFKRHGAKTVFFARMVPGVRSLISVPAGICGMPLPTYLVWTTAGSAIWMGALTWAGRALGESYDEVERFVGPVTYVVLGALLVWYVVFVVRRKQARYA